MLPLLRWAANTSTACCAAIQRPAQRLLCAGIAHAVPCRGHAVPAVQAMVCAMLEDAKLEVREMAATTLSGKLVP